MAGRPLRVRSRERATSGVTVPHWIHALLRLGRRKGGAGLGIDRESDVGLDPHVANTRAVGGGSARDADSMSTTGTGASQLFVGRVSGEDVGAYETSGAETRAEGAGEDSVRGEA